MPAPSQYMKNWCERLATIHENAITWQRPDSDHLLGELQLGRGGGKVVHDHKLPCHFKIVADDGTELHLR